MYACSSESQLYPGLHKKKPGQQVKGDVSSPLSYSCETPHRLLHPSLEFSVLDRHVPVRAGPKEGHEKEQRARTPSL